MSIKFKNNKNLKPQVILDRINKTTKANEYGTISFSDFNGIELRSVLYNLIEFKLKKSISSRTKENLILEAITKVRLSDKLNEKNFLEKLNESFNEYSKKREEEYVLLTSISLSEAYPFKKIRLYNTTIRFMNRFPKKYFERNKFLEKYTDSNIDENTYAKVLIYTKAKSNYDAMDYCLRALDLLRAMFSLELNPGFLFEFASSSLEKKGINVLQLGRFHTLHNKDGKLATKMFWYEPNYFPIKSHAIDSKNLKTIKNNINYMKDSIEKSFYKDKLIDSLVQYVRAFDEKDYNTTILKSWNSIELLLCLTENSFDKIPKRISFLFEDREYHKQILEHLREYRNSYVHEGNKNNGVKTYCYQLHFYYRKLILFYFRNSFNFKTLVEANNFLDLPHDTLFLKNKIDILQKAVKFIE